MPPLLVAALAAVRGLRQLRRECAEGTARWLIGPRVEVVADEDLDLPPASGDDVVQAFLDTNWREAVRAARDGMASIRRVYPELVQHLPETASRHMKRALDDLEAASRELHYAGSHVIGRDAYDEFIQAQTERQINQR